MAYDTNFTGFLNSFKTIISDTVRSLNNDDICVNIIEAAVCRLNALWRNLGRMLTSYPQVEEIKRSECRNTGLRLHLTGTTGRPRYDISREQLVFFVENGFSVKQIARLLHISISSVRRRMRSFGILQRLQYSDITDEDLDRRVNIITQHNSSLGQRMVQGVLQSEGITVQRARVAESLIRTDEAGVAIRWCRTVKRRTYSVSGPNALWHVDGNHKLIRWNMVIHGGIDGYSRLVVYLSIALDNKAHTAFQPFLQACNQYGIPSRVRTDHGLENLEIATFMVSQRGSGRGSIITGRSVHNQRIERLWRDMFQSCTSVFYELFYYLERESLLDIADPIQLLCLHYVYKPMIKSALDVFIAAWNSHRLRSERGQTPRKFFISRVLEQVGQGHRGIDDIFDSPGDERISLDDLADYGIDWNGPVPIEQNATITVPAINCPLSANELGILQQELNPLDDLNGLGISLYLRTLAFCNQV